MREKKVEEYLFEKVEEYGGLCLKLPALSYVGILDRLVLLPRGILVFVETKRPVGGRMGTKQGWWRSRLTLLGFRCVLIKTLSEVDGLFESIYGPKVTFG